MWKTILFTIKDYLFDLAKKAYPLLEALVLEEAKKALEDAEQFIHGETFDEAKKKLVEIAFQKINLPIILKPFKGILKNVVLHRLDNTLEKLLRDFKEKLK